MLCVIYKSPKKAQTYLFIKQRDKFEDVPEALMAMFGVILSKVFLVVIVDSYAGRTIAS